MGISKQAIDVFQQLDNPSQLDITQFDNWLREHFFALSISELLALKSHYVDEQITQIWKEVGLADSALSLNAVGGYGRQALFPHSDQDLCILHDHVLNDTEQKSVHLFITRLWDLGLKPGHAVRSLSQTWQAISEDQTIATNLLDIRCLYGPSSHAQAVVEQLQSQALWQNQDYFHAKAQEQSKRYEKFGGTAQYLEPELKHCPGGLRDIHTLHWLRQKGIIEASPSSQEHAPITVQEHVELLEAEQFISRVRWSLHWIAGRAEEKLCIVLQAKVADTMGFGADSPKAIEKMMRQLRKALNRVRELNNIVLLELEASPTRQPGEALDDKFEQQNGYINALNPTVFVERSQLIRVFFLLAQRSDLLGISPPTLKLIRHSLRRLLGELQDFDLCRLYMMKIFEHPQGMGKPLDLMHRFGLLSAYSPTWQHIEHQVHFDLAHTYTLDEHIYRMLKHLYGTSKGENTQLEQDIFADIDKPNVLFLAAFLHEADISLGQEANLAASQNAVQFCQLHGLDTSETELIAWLIKHQDLLSEAVQNQDVSLHEVWQSLATRVQSVEKLNYLFCLTLADLNTTHELKLDDWQHNLLELLYTGVFGVLNNVPAKELEPREVRHRRLARSKINKNTQLSTQDVDALWETLPGDFFDICSPSAIQKYTQLLLSTSPASDTKIGFCPKPLKGCSELLLHTPKNHLLYPCVFYGLASLNVDIRGIQIYQTREDTQLLILRLQDFNRSPITCPDRQERIKKKIDTLLQQGCPITPSKRPNALLKAFNTSPEVRFIASRQTQRTQVVIKAVNQTGTMKRICEVFARHKLNIHAGKFTELGESVKNVFTLSTEDGKGIDEPKQQALRLSIQEVLESINAPVP